MFCDIMTVDSNFNSYLGGRCRDTNILGGGSTSEATVIVSMNTAGSLRWHAKYYIANG